jgi:adenylate kinase
MIQLSTGDMLREARTSGTEMGRKVAEVMDRGDLVTDEIVIGLIEEKLEATRAAASSSTASPARCPRPTRSARSWPATARRSMP